MSPFGATRMTRGVLRPLAKKIDYEARRRIWNFRFGPRFVLRHVRCRLRRIRRRQVGGRDQRRTPGASVRSRQMRRRQCGPPRQQTPANPRRTRNPSRIHPTFVTINPLRNPPSRLQFLPQYPLSVQSHRIHRLAGSRARRMPRSGQRREVAWDPTRKETSIRSTRPPIANAISSSACSAASRIGVASPSATTSSQPTSPPPSCSPPSSSGGPDRVWSLA
jgi:hypothetical protein